MKEIYIIESYYGHNWKSFCGVRNSKDVGNRVKNMKMKSRVEINEKELIVYLDSREEKYIFLDQVLPKCKSE